MTRASFGPEPTFGRSGNSGPQNEILILFILLPKKRQPIGTKPGIHRAEIFNLGYLVIERGAGRQLRCALRVNS